MEIVADGGEAMGTIRDPALNEDVELPLERWSNLAHPGRIARYNEAQAGRTTDMIDNIQRVLTTWAEETPWAVKPVTKD